MIELLLESMNKTWCQASGWDLVNEPVRRMLKIFATLEMPRHKKYYIRLTELPLAVMEKKDD